MKRGGVIITILIAVATVVVSCSKSDRSSGKVYGSIVGEWHMVSWSGDTMEGLDLYIQFNDNRTFVEYQRLRHTWYDSYSGSYSVDDSLLTGVYNDSTVWVSTYEVSFNDDYTLLTLSSVNNTDDVTTFERCEIPSEVSDGAVQKCNRDGEESSERRFFKRIYE